MPFDFLLALAAFVPVVLSMGGKLATALRLKDEHPKVVEIRLGRGATLRTNFEHPEEVEHLADVLTNSAGASLP
jgi:hypothetical protein